jgi:hypothetical protein
MRAVVDAIRHYGIMICDNGGNQDLKRGSVWLEHNISAKWHEIGLNAGAFDALHALLEGNFDTVRMLAEPVFPGDESTVARYPGA